MSFHRTYYPLSVKWERLKVTKDLQMKSSGEWQAMTAKNSHPIFRNEAQDSIFRRKKKPTSVYFIQSSKRKWLRAQGKSLPIRRLTAKPRPAADRLGGRGLAQEVDELPSAHLVTGYSPERFFPTPASPPFYNFLPGKSWREMTLLFPHLG